MRKWLDKLFFKVLGDHFGAFFAVGLIIGLGLMIFGWQFESTILSAIGAAIGIITVSPFFFIMMGPMRQYDRELTRQMRETERRIDELRKAKKKRV